MSFINFGVISLVNYEQSSDIGTGRAVSSNTPLQGGGSIDDFGSGQTFAGVKKRNNKSIVLKSTAENLDLYLNQLKKLRGTRNKLTKTDANGDTVFNYARLTEVKENKTTKESRLNVKKAQSINLTFVCDSDTWFGDINESWKINDGELLNDNLVLNGGDLVDISSSPETHTITITQDNLESKIDTRGPVFTFSVPAGETFSSMLIGNDQGGSLLFTGTVAAEKQLVIDCAASRVLNDGVDAYDDLTVTFNTLSPHTWMAFLVGANELTFTHDGGGGAITVLIEYTEEGI